MIYNEKTLIHTRLIDRNLRIIALKSKLQSPDMHKSIIYYTLSILNDRKFQQNSDKYLQTMLNSIEGGADNVNISVNDIEKYRTPDQKILGAHFLLKEMFNRSRNAYNI